MEHKNMLKKRLLVLAILAGLPTIAFAGTPLQGMQADAAAIQSMTKNWSTLENAASTYANLAPYSAQEWAGAGPVVSTPIGGEEQCHNTHWDTVTNQLVTGGLNIFGDAEAEAYAIQTVTADFQTQLADYEEQQVKAGNTAIINQIDAQKGPMNTSLNTLMSLLSTTGDQVASAMSPGTLLHELPISQWQAGIGNVPDLSTVQYMAGPDDGAPIGWYVQPKSELARLVDVCPTGTGDVPMYDLAGAINNNVQQMITDSPSMAQVVQSVEGGSTYSAPSPSGVPSDLVQAGIVFRGGENTRMQLVSVLASDMQPLSGYMQPIGAPLMLYSQQVQQIMTEVGK
ncbi:hypothetical protein BAE47_14845 [Acidithiobacillus thiooxidans]|nr:hypothetical protein BAE47_14845 [Acidithiobacillus thiooxidans]